MLGKNALVLAAVLVHGPLAAPPISADTRSRKVQVAGCAEFGRLGTSFLGCAAQPFVPAGYVIAGATNGQAAIVVRATSCEGVSVDQSAGFAAFTRRRQ